MSTYARGTDPHEPLEAVLRAASAPGHPEELAGEEKAAAAFRVAVPAPRRRSLLARVLTVKALVVGTVATSTGVVLATAGGVLPILRPEPTPGPPADPPSETQPASVPTAPPLDVRPLSEPVAPPTTSTSAPSPPVTGEPPRQDDEQDDRPRSGRNAHRNGNDEDPQNQPGNDTPPPSGERPEEQNRGDNETSGPPGREETPDSPAHGAVTAVPPNGAEPPSPGD